MEPRIHCQNCGSRVEPLAFCGVCGRPLPAPGLEVDRSPRGRLVAALAKVRARPLTSLIVAAAVLVFLLLLADAASVAMLVALLIGPVLLINYLSRLDLYEREPWTLMAGVVAASAALGLLTGWLSSAIFDRFWFTDSGLNLGAIGFAGVSANGRGGVPFLVLLLNGLLIPVLTGAAIIGGAILLRRFPAFRNEVTDGMTLGGLASAGIATITSFVYFWPSVFDDLPDRPVSEWTAIVAGTVVIRPIVLVLAGSLLGIAAWQYLSTKDVRTAIVAGVGGVFGWLALPIGSLALAQSGAVAEFVWYSVVLVAVGLLFREALGRGITRDGAVLAPEDGQQRVVCPTCRRLTPDGSFCAFCRSPLHERAPTVLATARLAASEPAMNPFPDREPGAATPSSAPAARVADTAPVFAPRLADDSPASDRGAQVSDVGDGSGEAVVVADAPGSGPIEPNGALSEDPLEFESPSSQGTGRAGGEHADQPAANVSDHDPLSASQQPESMDSVGEQPSESVPAPSDLGTRTGPSVQGPADDEITDDLAWTSSPTQSTDPLEADELLFPPGEPDGWYGDSRRAESPDDSEAEFDTNAMAAEPLDPDIGAEVRGTAADPHDGDGAAPATAEAAEEPTDREYEGLPKAGAASFAPPPLQSFGDARTASTGRPVSSSSGRWFQASSAPQSESRPEPVSATGEAGLGAPGPVREPIPLFPPAAPVGLGREAGAGPGTEATGAEGTPARSTPPGLRWYRSEDAPANGDDDTPVDTPDAPMIDPLANEYRSRSREPEAATPEGPEEGTSRGGLWRQLTRGARSAGPRAPQRDQDRQRAEPPAGQDPGQSDS